MKSLFIVIIALALFAIPSYAACTGSSPTWTAASASEMDLDDCLTAASNGDTINVPPGSATWSSVSISKAVTIIGSGTGSTLITVGAHQGIIVTKSSAGIIRVKNIGFTITSTNIEPFGIYIQGSWLGAEPIIFDGNTFDEPNYFSNVFQITVAGGFIAANNTFNGYPNADANYAFHMKALSDTASWTTADSMGMADTDGKKNIYIEHNTFNYSPFGISDCDDNCRVVMRYNTFVQGGGFNSHGKDTSPYGMRQFEVYNNTFSYPYNGCDEKGNVQFYVWIRGGTGLVYNNTMDEIVGCWGSKNEIIADLRAASEPTLIGLTCGTISYPISHQIGQNNNGSSDFTDPIYYYSNVATSGSISNFNSIQWGYQCGFLDGTYIQTPRDYIDSGASSNSKPGYTAYTYPHPLLDSAPPAALGNSNRGRMKR